MHKLSSDIGAVIDGTLPKTLIFVWYLLNVSVPLYQLHQLKHANNNDNSQAILSCWVHLVSSVATERKTLRMSKTKDRWDYDLQETTQEKSI